MGSPVHVQMLSIQAMRGLPCLRAPGIVPCIIARFVIPSRLRIRTLLEAIDGIQMPSTTFDNIKRMRRRQ